MKLKITVENYCSRQIVKMDKNANSFFPAFYNDHVSNSRKATHDNFMESALTIKNLSIDTLMEKFQSVASGDTNFNIEQSITKCML